MKTIREIRRDVQPHWVGDGFPVRSLFAYHEGSAFDPFLLLDYAGPYKFPPTGQQRGVGEHPHRGFETVTIVYQGELEHRDSSGAHGSIGPGDVQWMTAAAGVVHEEFHSARMAREGGVLEMVQLWVNLPSREKMSKPRYQELRDAAIPRMSLPKGAGTVRVIAGDFAGTKGAARTVTPINAWDIELAAGAAANLPAPAGHTTVLIVQSGAVTIGSERIESVALVLLDRAGEGIDLQSADGARVLVLTGEPLGEPVVGQGPFVMNTREEIRQAIDDYQAGRMGVLE